jgi:hypothetical protein
MGKTNAETGISSWKSLYRIGGVAPLITLTIYLSQLLIIIVSGETYPTTPESWFALFQRSKPLGLIFLNALDVFSIAILGLMFLALYVALRSTNPSYMAVATFFAFLGVAVFVSARAEMVTATLSLSNQFAIATTEAQRSQILAAGHAVMALSRATPETLGFFFITIASLIISVVILQSGTFSKMIAYLGILGSVIVLANDISIVIAPSMATILMPLSGLVWLIWWILVGQKLLRLERKV